MASSSSARPPAARTPGSISGLRARSTSDLSVLVVDDDPMIHRVVERTLGKEGIHVSGCLSAEAALRAGTVNAYDVVLLDVALRDESGIEVCIRLRQAGYDRGIIMLSGLDTANIKARALDAGADDYVTKPFDARELAARVNALVRRFPRPAGPALEIDGRSVSVRGVSLRLSGTEREILLRIHQAGSEGVELAGLFDLVSAADREHAVHVHVSRIRKKLGQVGLHLRLQEGRFRLEAPAR